MLHKLVHVLDRCRICESKKLIPILSLGELFVSNFLDVTQKDLRVKAPLELVLCNKKEGGCGLLQLKHTVSRELMFRNYWYRSGINKSMTDELNDIGRLPFEVKFNAILLSKPNAVIPTDEPVIPPFNCI